MASRGVKGQIVVPSFGHVLENLRAIEALLESLQDDYRVLHDLATTPGSRKLRRASAPGVRHTDVSNPTQASALDMMRAEKDYLRRKARKTAKLIGQMLARGIEARDTFDEVFERPSEETAGAVEGGDERPVTEEERRAFVTKKEQREAAKAKARRRARGEL